MTAAILLAALFPAAPLRDLATGARVDDAVLVRPASYVLLAPLSDVLDTLTALTPSQHVALAIALAAVFAGWRAARRPSLAVRRSVVVELRTAGGAALVYVALYAAMIAAPRPMVALRLRDPALLSIDFHSHTNASHDARAGFSVAANRDWHRRAGFDAAYVTDHHSFRGVAEALLTNPVRAGDGTMLLPALEAAYQKEEVIILGSAHDAGTAPVRQWAGGHTPLDADAGLVLTLPGAVATFVTTGVRQSRLLGIELSDASPRGIAESDAKRSAIIALGHTIGAALLTGSDNHGWGRSAIAWSVMSIPGWRAMSADTLDARIRATLRSDGLRAARPLGRARVSSAGGPVACAATAPAVAWLMVRTLSWPERLAWLGWIWTVAALVYLGDRLRRRERRRQLSTDEPPIRR